MINRMKGKHYLSNIVSAQEFRYLFKSTVLTYNSIKKWE